MLFTVALPVTGLVSAMSGKCAITQSNKSGSLVDVGTSSVNTCCDCVTVSVPLSVMVLLTISTPDVAPAVCSVRSIHSTPSTVLTVSNANTTPRVIRRRRGFWRINLHPLVLPLTAFVMVESADGFATL